MRWTRALTLLCVSAAGLIGLSCSSDSNEPDPVATTLASVSGNAQTGTVGTALASPITVKVTDQDGAGMAGVAVVFAVTGGGGNVGAVSVNTDANGLASTTWTLGNAPGANNNTATAGVAGLTGSPVAFTASANVGPAAQITKASGDVQTATVGAVLALPIVATVKDAFNNVLSGVTVNWAVTAGGGNTAAATSVTDAAGVASTTWTLGTVAGIGNQSATVTVAGAVGVTATFTASATAGPAAVLAIVSGNNQSAMVGTGTAAPLVVSVKDAFNNNVANVAVTWAAATGGGWTSATSVATSAAGTASVTRTLGATVGAQTATASVAGATPASVTFNATGTSLVSGYGITLRYLSAISPAHQAVFEAAAARWASIIIGDVPDINAAGVPAGGCGDNSPALNEVVDDVLIFVTLDSIDGQGQVLGSAGPCYLRTGTKLSLIGQMLFDTADVAFMETNGIFQAVMLHEMGHVIGIGSLWTQPPSLLVGSVFGGGTDPYFNGATAIARFAANGGGVYLGTSVPVEALYGPGTQDSHWRESVMGKELMTGFVSLVSNPLSQITIGSLTDMGYAVSYANADPYTVSGVNLQVPGGAGEFRLIEGVPDWTLKGIDAQGRITRVR